MNHPQDREEAIFEAALQLPPEQRAEQLKQACGDDAPLRQRVELLLKSHEQASGDFLEKPHALGPKKTMVVSPSPPIEELLGTMIGRYKLLEKIGEGGFGVVYVAEQREPVKRRVALKIIKLGMDTKQVIARFEVERQALAMMDHPNIAKVFDASATETGRPYFVMELVRGIRITDYCNQNNLATRERLELFAKVCQAIQHAHQKGIIHRDIKPSNLLVTLHDGVPVPKVIDFGIAKATQGELSEHTVYTQLQQFIGTPAYMSPEQAEMSGLDIDTRSDIYALGVLLYELLTGKTPLDQKDLLSAGVDGMRRMIREQEPQRPSTRVSSLQGEERTSTAQRHSLDAPKLAHLLQGDLDWIVMKCLEKDRTRRYETANGVAADLQRHLNNEPVSARPPSAAYRFQKMVRRNKLAFAAASAITAALLLGLGISTWMFFKEKQARQRANIEATKSGQVAQFMKDMLKGVGPSVALGRDTMMLREIVDNTAQRISTDLKDQAEVEIELRLTLAQVYFNLELYKKMEETARVTLRLARANLGEENLAVADSLGQIGRALFFIRDMDEAETLTRQSIAMQRKLRGHDSLQEADSLRSLGDILRHQWYRSGRPESKAQLVEAENSIRAGLAIFRSRLGNDNDEVAWAFHILQHVLADEGKHDEAEAAIREGLAIRRKIHGEEHPYTGVDYCCLGDSLLMQNKLAEAESNYRVGLDILERTCGKGKWHQAWAHNGLALALAGQSKPGEAEIHQREALGIARQEMGAAHSDLPGFIDRLANILRQQGKLAETESLYREVLASQRKLLGSEHLDVAASLSSLSFLLREEGKLPEAETTAREALAIRKKLLGNEHTDVAQSLHLLAWNLKLQGKQAEAEALSREEVAMWRKLLGNEHPNVAWALGDLTVFLSDQGKLAEAETLWREELASRKQHFGEEHRSVEESLAALAKVLQQEGNLAEAETVWREELALEIKLSGDGHPFVATSLRWLASVLAELTEKLLVQQKFTDAERPARECIIIREQQLPDAWQTFNARSLLGGSLLGQKKYAEAEPLLVSSYEGMKQREDKIPAIGKIRLQASIQRLVELYTATSQSEKAAEWKKKLAEFDQTESEKKTAAPQP